MTGTVVAGALALLMSSAAVAQTGRTSGFTPARLLSGPAPPLPSPNTIGSIAESLELSVDATGHVQVVAAAPATPGASLVSPTAASWRFQPASESGAPVASRVLVAAIYRAPQLYDLPGSMPVNLAAPSSEIPFPTTTASPPYPPLAVADAVAIVEVLVETDGRVTAARLMNRAPGFESAALAAARSWSFHPAQRRGQAVPAYAYLVFGFRRPMTAGR